MDSEFEDYNLDKMIEETNNRLEWYRASDNIEKNIEQFVHNIGEIEFEFREQFGKKRHAWLVGYYIANDNYMYNLLIIGFKEKCSWTNFKAEDHLVFDSPEYKSWMYLAPCQYVMIAAGVDPDIKIVM